MSSAAPSTVLSDPCWIPLGYDASTDRFRLVRVDDELLTTAAFLDQRVGQVWNEAFWIDAGGHAISAAPSAPAWLFHTAFCCSTLLARALHAPPASICLKEPSVLLDLAQVSLNVSWRDPRLAARIRDSVHLLARPRQQETRTLIKPTNPANRLLSALLDVMPRSRGLLLYGNLENFLMSCVKKLPGAEEPMRWMAGYLLPGTRLQRELDIPRDHRLNFIESCVLTWFAQMEIYADALAADAGDRLRSLDMQALLQHPSAAVEASRNWLELGGNESREETEARIANAFSRNSKQADTAYGPERRAEERAQIMGRYGDVVRAALSWAERQIAPYATLPANWKPLLSAELAQT